MAAWFRCCALGVLLLAQTGVEAAVLNVPSEFYPTIQSAIGAAASGDIIHVAAGTYPENVTIDRRITLDGAGPATIIRPISGNGIVIAASGSGSNDPLSIRDLTIAGCPGNGIRIDSAVNYLSLANVTVSNCASYGFEIHNTGVVTGLMLTNCAFVDMTNSIGIVLRGSLSGLRATDCLFKGNQYGFQSVKGNGDGTVLSDVVFDRCTFIDNAVKGAYFEKLSDAVFDQVVLSANGSVAPYPAGIDINLKYGAYSNIALIAPAVADCGLGDPGTGVGIAIKARNDGAYASSPASLIGLAISDAIVTRCPFGISIGNNILGASVQNSALAGNFVLGLFNWTDAAALAATNNWWGDDAGPSQPATNPPGSLFSGFGDRVYWTTNNALAFLPALDTPALSNVLYLLPKNTSVFIRPGEGIIVDMNVANLTTNVNACQAFLGYSSTYFGDPNGGAVQPGGGVWDDLIYDVWRDTTNGVPGEIDTAIGIDATNAHIGVGTTDDGTVAKIALTSRAGVEGVTHIIFRPDADPGSGQIESTFFSSVGGDYPIWPTKIDSATIYIDGTPPAMNIAAIQDQPPAGFIDVKDGTSLVLNGTVLVVIAASDTLSGLEAPPSLTITNGSQTTSATYIGESPAGIFNYSWEVTPTTPGGIWTATATATDRAGNQAANLFELYLRTFAVTGLVELEGFRGTGTGHSRAVTFAATGGTYTKTWTQSLSNSSGAIFTFAVDDAPPGTTHLSAKTAWNLRKRIPVSFDASGHASASFTGASRLRAGDIDGNNQIQTIDYSRLRAAWLSANAEADINGDGSVQTLDYSLLRGNWLSFGDAQ